MRKISLLLIGLLIPFIASAHAPATSTHGKVASLAPMLAKITPDVVNIAVEKKAPTRSTFQEMPQAQPKQPKFYGAVGSGVIFNAKKGLIVTNAHVVANEKIMLVTLKDGRRYRAHLVGEDDGFDIAIIKIPAHHLSQITFSDSDNLRVGDFVAAIGSPFGLTQTVTSGVISALNRAKPKIEGFQSFIQTDAPINPGNSGGALVNLRGELVGINTAILGPDANIGIGFAIPSNMVKAVITQLLKYGKVKRGMLGVIAQNITPSLASALNIGDVKGTIVTKIVPGSAAATAGLKPEDIITELDGKTIRSAVQLRNNLGLMPPDTKITLTILRNHRRQKINAVVGNPAKLAAPKAIPFIAGLSLRNFNELEADGRPLIGALVTDVSPNSAAALAGIVPGDVITQANQKPVKNVTELVKIAKKQQKPLLIKVTRGNENLFLVIEPIEQ